jgi:ATP phosphoribosyltransferase
MSGQRLRIAIQKSGRLADRSLELIQAAGLKVMKGANELLYRVENAPIDLVRVRDDDIPTLVGDGIAQIGIVGLNVLTEHFPDRKHDDMILMRLGFGRCTLKIAVPDGFDYQGPSSLNGLRIATSYPNCLKAWLSQMEVDAHIVEMRGAVEVAPRMKIAQAICDLVSTGATLEANGLVAKEIVLKSEAVLIQYGGNVPETLKPTAAMLLRRFDGVVASQGAKYIMLNAPRDHLDEIIRLIPGADAPTIMELAGRQDVVAVHAVCEENVFWDSLEALKKAGASAILVLPIEKMMK